MDKRFHVFVRKLAAGAAVSCLTQPHLGAFGETVDAARRDLAFVLRRLLAHGRLREERAFFADARLRRLQLVLRCLHGRRLLEVPMRFSAVVSAGAEDAPRGTLRVLVPRLGLDGALDDAADLDAYLEEVIRHELHLAPLARLTDVAYTGEESLETMIVPVPAGVVRPAAAPAKKRPAPLPPALGEVCRRLDPGDDLERAYQRDAEVAQLDEVLSSRRRASVLLVGPAGVGKTCLVHELAARASEPRRRLTIFSTSAGRIIAGMRYLGEWQERLGRMLAELRTRRAVLHFDSLTELLSLRAGDALDLARFLLPAIEAGDVTVIVEATAEDVARAQRSHAPLVQALRPLVLTPLDGAAARRALVQAAQRIGRGRSVRFVGAALDRALDLAERFDEGCLPGAAVALLRAAADTRAPVLDAGPITAAFCARTGYPAALVDPALPLDPDAVRAHFEARVLGQPHATSRLAQLVVTLKTNLTDPRKPLGSFLLLGPTGVGKTESALALTTFLFGDERRLRRVDMAEYAAPGSAARLLADDPQGLVRRTREQPFGVLLLDEIEKAHAGVLDLLLQLLGEGRLSDERGRGVSFRNTIVVLTSNLGAETAGRSLGFGGGGDEAPDAATHYRSAAAAFFRPELLARFDQVIPYRPLARAVVRTIARLALDAALAREGLQRRAVTVTFDDGVIEALVALGFDPLLGARPLKRAIEEHVVAPLAELLGRSVRPPRRLVLRATAAGGLAIDSV